MKKTQVCLIFLSSLFALTSNAQKELSSGSVKTIKATTEFTFSVFAGGSLLGPGSQITNQMCYSGFDDTEYNWFSKSNVAHPHQKNWPVYDFSLGMYFSPRSGLSGSFGLCSNLEVSGIESVGLGNFLFLNSKLSFYSIDYLYRTLNKKQILSVGLILFNYRIKDTSGIDPLPWDSSIHPGIDLGYTANLYSGKSFFIDFKTNLRLAPNTRIGPYIKSNTLLEKYTSEFEVTDINLTSLTIGLQFGLRIAGTKEN